MDVTTFRAAVRSALLPGTTLTDPEIDAAAATALVELNQKCPLVHVVEETLEADGTFDVSGLTGWGERSRVRRVEYPIDEVPASLVPPQCRRVIESSTGPTLAVYGMGAAEVRIEYTAEMTFAEIASIPDDLARALVLLTASEILAGWAASWAQKAAISVAGDDFDGPSPREARSAAKGRRAEALRIMSPPVIAFG